MDFPLAAPVRDALQAAIDADDCGYPHPARLARGVRGASRAARWGWTVDPARVRLVPDVMVGVTEVLRAADRARRRRRRSTRRCTRRSSPRSPSSAAGRRGAARRGDGGWELDLDALERAFAARRTGVPALQPAQPDRPRVRPRRARARSPSSRARYGVAVVSDEIHAPLTLAGATHTPFAALGEEPAAPRGRRSRARRRRGTSPASSAPCSCAARRDGGRARRRCPRASATTRAIFGVLATIAAFESGGAWLDELARVPRRQPPAARASCSPRTCPRCGYVPPEAGYLAWLDCRALGLGDDPAEAFLERGRVALSSGPDVRRAGPRLRAPELRHVRGDPRRGGRADGRRRSRDARAAPPTPVRARFRHRFRQVTSCCLWGSAARTGGAEGRARLANVRSGNPSRACEPGLTRMPSRDGMPELPATTGPEPFHASNKLLLAWFGPARDPDTNGRRRSRTARRPAAG